MLWGGAGDLKTARNRLTVAARQLEQHYPHALRVKQRGYLH